MAKFDVESAFYGIVGRIKNTLNSKILEINNEKGEQILESFEPDSFVEGNLDERVMNFDQTVFSYIESINSTANGSTVSKRLVVEIDLIIAQRNDYLDYKRILRYQRSLEECALSAWGKTNLGYGECTISSLDPIDVKLFNASYFSKVIGIQIEFTFN